MIFDPFDNIVHELGLLLGKPDDQMRCLVLFFLAYPIAYVFRKLNGKWKRHAYSIIVGIVMQTFMYRLGSAHYYILGAIVWVILTIFNRQRVAWIVMVVSMTYLSVRHIYRMINDYGGWSMDDTLFLMPLVARISSLGFVYADGGKDANSLSKEQEARKVTSKPTLIEICSYIAFPGSNIAGPFFEFRDYVDFIEQRGRYEKIPSSFGVSMKKLAVGLILIALCIFIPMNFDLHSVITEKWFDEMPIYRQLAFWLVACFGIRCTYYVAWVINDGSIMLSGLSYAGKTEHGVDKFDKICNVDILGVELCTVPREGIGCWNAMIAEWLRLYIYERIKGKEKGSNTFATVITNLVSGFWHGFYPIYYPTFLYLAFISEVGKDVYRIRHVFGFIPSPLSEILRNVLILSALNYTATGMVFLELDKAFNAFRKYYFFGHVGLFGMFFVLRFYMVPKFQKKKKKD